MSTSNLSTLLIVAIVLAAGGCASAGTALELDGSRWQLANAEKGALASAAAKGVTMEFAGDRVTGNSGCNSYNGDYRFDGKVLKVGPVAATKRGCMDERAAIEAAWFEALAQPLSVKQQGSRLVLEAADGARYEFSASTGTQSD